MYFKKGNETWGSPFDSTGWLQPHSVKPDVHAQVCINVFPNPLRNQAEIQLWDKRSGDFIIEIADLYGKLVKTYIITASISQIDLTGISQGVYMMRLFRNGELIGTEKIIKIQD
ncbi:MAG: T9SS type A sorting domain-containing protein [Bacteroidetes bacterium]|nr:T9SS type A sorting domain-containing protein [Bacteroidota bacterium]